LPLPICQTRLDLNTVYIRTNSSLVVAIAGSKNPRLKTVSVREDEQ